MACSPEMLEGFNIAAKQEIKESLVNLNEMVQRLRHLVSIRYPKLQLPPDEGKYNVFLEMCLRVRKFNLERAAEQVHKFFKLMESVSADKLFLPSLYQQDFYETYGATVLKERDALGRRILFFDNDKFPSNVFDMDKVLAAVMLLKFEMLRTSVETQRIGIVYLINVRTYDLKHAGQVATRLRTSAKMVTGSFPLRIKDFHLVNSGAIFRCTVELFKPLLGWKIYNRLHAYGTDLTSMYATLSPDILPKCVGGNLSIDQTADKEFIRNMAASEEFYKKFFKWGYVNGKQRNN